VRNNFLHRDGHISTDDDIIKVFNDLALKGVKRHEMPREHQIVSDNYYAILFKRKENYQEIDGALTLIYQKISALL
jgi:hypothetical protein